MSTPNISIFAPNGSKFRTLFYTTIISVLSNFYQAYAISYTNTAVESFRAFINESYVKRGTPLSPSASLWIWSMMLNCVIIGNLAGTVFSPIMTEKYGRRSQLVFLCLCFIFSETEKVYFLSNWDTTNLKTI
ncbi:sugar transporter domain-containing protein [Ditylenchus destructor]|uniref:Sugar transporter domain-containing protein n=1 Tax=Ditylenchus destructor TaxID=166010 RepID=A0AAD4R1Q9_9BILA|nr:sugar transporter domain-containing protein [Ditylenchus destructor]